MNRMGFYSDANIMAESQETGSILVTSNTKHFIFYEINKFNENGSINPARREMIRKIFTLLGLNKNCLPYSLEETIQILEEKAKDRNNEEDLNKEKVQGNNKNKKEETVQTKRIKAEENDYGCFEREF